ncbi:hypothetical protein ABIE06_003439 [Pantoea dispersa]
MNDFNDRVTFLPEGVEWTQLYTKCPCCGFDLNKVPQALVEQIQAEQAKQRSSNAKFSLKACTKILTIPDLLNNCVARMVLPFTKAKKESAERSKKRFFGWKVRKKSCSSGKKNDGAN